METSNPLIPLTPAVFYILLALAAGERHGYQIMKQVRLDSQGQVKMGPARCMARSSACWPMV